MSSSVVDKVEDALNTIRPFLREDGGDVEVISIEKETLKLKFVGTCQQCEMSHMTFNAGIKDTITQNVPEIKSIEIIDK